MAGPVNPDRPTTPIGRLGRSLFRVPTPPSPSSWVMLIRASWYFVPLSPVAVLYFRHLGFDTGQIAAIFSLFLFVGALVDVPSSIVAEVFSRQLTLALSCLLKAIGGFLLVASPDFERVLLAYAFIAVANGIYSGIDVSLLMSEAEDEGRTAEDIRVLQGRAYVQAVVVVLLASVVGGIGGWLWGLDVIAYVNAATACTPGLLALGYLLHRGITQTGTSRGRLADLLGTARAVATRGALAAPLRDYGLIAVSTAVLTGLSLWLFNLYQIRVADILSDPLKLGLLSIIQVAYTLPLTQQVRRAPMLLSPSWQPVVVSAGLWVAFVMIWQSPVWIVVAGMLVLEITRSYLASQLHARVMLATLGSLRAVAGSLMSLLAKMIAAGVLWTLGQGSVSFPVVYTLGAAGLGLLLLVVFSNGRATQVLSERTAP